MFTNVYFHVPLYIIIVLNKTYILSQYASLSVAQMQSSMEDRQLNIFYLKVLNIFLCMI